MSGPILYVTGTNTGAGKTTLAVQILERLRERNIRAAAMKPFCSGGRDDALRLHAGQTADLSLDEVNPFYFDEPIAPLPAARQAGIKITLEQTIRALDAIRRENLPLLIEGAGGLLSPLGEGFSLLEIIRQRPGRVCIVGPNSLGVINLMRLTSLPLPVERRDQAIVLADFGADASSATNAALLKELLPGANLFEPPWALALDALIGWWLSFHLEPAGGW